LPRFSAQRPPAIPAPLTKEQRQARQADTALLADVTQAGAEFRRRLHERVALQDGILLIREIYTPKVSTLYGFPASSPWSISCGFVGLNITFGAGTSEGGGVMDIDLSQANLNEEQCRKLVPLLAREVAAIIRSEPGSLRRIDR
jgi:hypothetical protein